MRGIALILTFCFLVARFQPARPSVLRDKGSPKIISGRIAPLHGIPYVAYIISGEYCTGVLLNSEWVLTSASCVYGKTAAISLVGSLNIHHDDPEEQELFNSNIITHENYVSGSNHDDIALIKYDESANITAAVQPIALATNKTKNYAGLTGQISGWGSDSLTSIDFPSSDLRFSDDVILTNKECQDRMGSSTITEDMICLGTYTKRPPCEGDSGAPLVVIEDGKPTLVGIHSFHAEKCDPQYPSVFTRVTSYIDWITEKMSNSELIEV